MDFKVGDNVKMCIDGSPVMTITSIIIDGQFRCVWQDARGESRRGTFDARWIERCDERDA